ncbi:uncharacterized protein AB9W97_002366 [Spinachia spinachia]
MYHGEELQSSGIHTGVAVGPIHAQQVDPEPQTQSESNQGTSGPSDGPQPLNDMEFRIKELHNRRFFLMEMQRFMKKTEGNSGRTTGGNVDSQEGDALRALDHCDNDSASTSADTGSCNTSVEVVGKRGNKRKVTAAEGGPKTRKKTILDNEEETKQRGWLSYLPYFGHCKANNLPVSVKTDPDVDSQEGDALRALDHCDNDSASTSADTGSCNTSVEVVGKRGNKRKVTAAEGGPKTKRKRSLDNEEETKQKGDALRALDHCDNDSASTSADTGSCNTSVEVVGKRGNKRKVTAAEGGPKTKRKRSLDNEEETKQNVDSQEGDALRALDHCDNDSASTSADTGSCNTSVEVVGKRGNKRKVTAAEGGPKTKRKRSLDNEEETKQRGWLTYLPYFGHCKANNLPVIFKTDPDVDSQEGDALRALDHCDNDSASTSADTGSCNTSVEVVGKRGNKRKVTAAEGGPKTKRKRSLDNEEETKQRGWLSYLPYFGRRKRDRESEEEFEAKYEKLDYIAEGGFGSVFAGRRRADNLPVAIKYVPNKKVNCKYEDDKGNTMPMEVAIMLKLSVKSKWESPNLSLLDWYQFGKALVLVMERPMPAVTLLDYILDRDNLKEKDLKIIIRQLVDAALHLERNDIFHRDIKLDNILIETSSNVPRVHLIDFGVSCFDNKTQSYANGFGDLSPEDFLEMETSAGPTTVFQIGVALYNALQLEDPFDTLTFIQRQRGLPKIISKNCKDFLQRCLEVHPDDRPTLKQLRKHKWLR